MVLSHSNDDVLAPSAGGDDPCPRPWGKKVKPCGGLDHSRLMVRRCRRQSIVSGFSNARLPTDRASTDRLPRKTKVAGGRTRR